ncbi:TA2R9 protein, partial [Mionectes macconnelli]|nr:TA2R9 protein [Mionectes macconnelli]
SPEQFSVTSYDATAVAIISFEVFAGMWINAFIVSVIGISWIKKKTLKSNEKILLVVGCSRFLNLCVSWINSFFSKIYPHFLYVHSTLTLVVSIESLLNYCNIWFSACLCVFYCIKIANFRNRFFNYLKVKIDRMVPWLLLGSVLFSLVIGTIVYDVTDKALCKNLNFTCQGCIWKASIRIEEHFFPIFFITGFGFVTSFMTVTFSALFLLFSLWRHKHNMQTNSMKDLSMDAHIKAMKSILSFLVMYSINFVFLILALIYLSRRQSYVNFLIPIFLCAFPGFHSLILIFSNPKLEKKMLGILSCMNYKVCIR